MRGHTAVAVAVEHWRMRNKPEPSLLQRALVDIAMAEDYFQRGARLVADVAVRRWRSFHRRHRRRSATLEDRVWDLARGLRERLLEDPIYEEPGAFPAARAALDGRPGSGQAPSGG
jgi:hypothetical protein